MQGVNRVADCYEKSNMRPLEVVIACCGSNEPGDCFTLAPTKFLRKDANEAIKKGAVGRKVAKEFEGVVYGGVLTEYLPKEADDEYDLWQIKYDDGDDEQWSKKDLADGIMLYEEDPPAGHSESEDESGSEFRGGASRGSDEPSDDESSDDESS